MASFSKAGVTPATSARTTPPPAARLAALQDGEPFANNCNFLPQAEFFEAPFGATVGVDNRRFPDSMNELFKESRSVGRAWTHQGLVGVFGGLVFWVVGT